MMWTGNDVIKPCIRCLLQLWQLTTTTLTQCALYALNTERLYGTVFSNHGNCAVPMKLKKLTEQGSVLCCYIPKFSLLEKRQSRCWRELLWCYSVSQKHDRSHKAMLQLFSECAGAMESQRWNNVARQSTQKKHWQNNHSIDSTSVVEEQLLP